MTQPLFISSFMFFFLDKADGGKDTSVPITQECLNTHVLKVDPATQEYPTADGHGKTRRDYTGVKPWFRCKQTGGHQDTSSNTPNEEWPKGSCCNGGGACSSPAANDDRWIVPSYSTGSYNIKLRAPAGIECERCVLQWFYQTGNSRDMYPEGFWNCAGEWAYPCVMVVVVRLASLIRNIHIHSIYIYIYIYILRIRITFAHGHAQCVSAFTFQYILTFFFDPFYTLLSTRFLCFTCFGGRH